jgi:hypothetical protein
LFLILVLILVLIAVPLASYSFKNPDNAYTQRPKHSRATKNYNSASIGALAGSDEEVAGSDEADVKDDKMHRPTRPRVTQTLETILTECKQIFEYVIEKMKCSIMKVKISKILSIFPMTSRKNTDGYIFMKGKGLVRHLISNRG